MPQPILQLTHKELELILRDDWHDGRFKILNDDIPKDGHSSQYIEDDGRQYRYFEFEDTATGAVYGFSYVWYADYPVEVPMCLFNETPTGLAFVNESVLVAQPEPVVPPAEVLTPTQQADKDLWAQYEAVKDQMSQDERDLKKIPKERLKELLAFLRSPGISILDVRAKLVPVMLEYQLHDKMLWTHVQQKLGHWKKPKKVKVA